MNAALMKRIVRAIAERSTDDLDALAELLIESERSSGHVRIAEQLESAFRSARQGADSGRSSSPRRMMELPSAKRGGELLLTMVPQERLEHHMVLPVDVESRFCRIESEYAARERLGMHGLKPRKTVLLYGPPGCGKSLGAQRLAWNTGLPLLKVRFDAILSSYFGESAANLRAVFDAAKSRPCVLLLDECDFIARSRTGNRDIGEASRIVNSLLLLMDEFDAPGLLVATTNTESALDPAFIRRFDDSLLIPKPGVQEVERLLADSLRNIGVEQCMNWQMIVATLAGASAADVVKVARDAAKATILAGEKTVTRERLDAAIRELKRLDA
ncbi:MAG: ATP-binding protein [Planctomycetaceae bacterium]|nr:ATP-binding protein [Planctomycetaceae bacterium]